MSLLSKFSFAISGICLVGFAISRLILGAWFPFLWVLLGLFVFFALIPVFSDRKILIEFFTMRTTKHGMNMGALILMVITSLGLVNYLSTTHYATFDFSATKTNTLSEQSIKLIKSLDSDLKVLFFYKKGNPENEANRKAFREIIKKYQDQSTKVQLDFVEIDERPALAKDYGVDKGSGLAFFDYKGRRNRIEKLDEQELTSALVKVTRDKNKTIYFVIGHGEPSLEEAKEALGLNAIKLMLENNRYTVKTHPLTTIPKVPEDADVLAIIGPKQEFQENEINGLREFLKKGGNLFLALKTKQKTNLEQLTKEVGVELGDNYIVSVIEIPGIGKNVDPKTTLGSVFSPTHTITKSFGQAEITLFHFPQSLIKSSIPVAGITVDEIVKTGGNGMAFKDLNFDKAGEEKDFALVDAVKGKFPGAGASDKEFNMVIAGESDFLSNVLLYKNLNRDLFLNTMATLAREENLVSITPKEPEVTKMELTTAKFVLFLFGYIIPLPLLLFGTSITLFLRRRSA